ncbi:MAG: TIGR00366 family protein [Bacteroidota bacterium]
MKITDRLFRVLRDYLPSPFSLAILLTVVTFVLAAALTEPETGPEAPGHFWQLLGHWEAGFWSLLTFAMQMMLMLVLGHVLALTRPVRKLVDRALVFCRDSATAALTVTLLTVAVALFNWGLGLIFGAILARKVGEYATRNRIPINYPLIGAAGYSGLMVWHGGISGSAPLKVAEAGHQFVALTGGDPIPVTETLLSGMNLVLSGVLLIVLPLGMYLLARRSPATIPQLSSEGTSDLQAGPETPADRLDYSRAFSLLIGGGFLLMFLYAFWIRPGHVDVTAINPNLINLFLLALCLLLHAHVRGFLRAADHAIRDSTGIMIQFPIYAGILGIMTGSGLIDVFSDFFVRNSTETTFPIYTLFSAGLVNFFVPSGGGQWAVQGGIVLQAANELGVAQPKAIMALAYGDQLTNMMQPFWALPLLGITGLKAGQILPYTLYLLLLGLLVFGIGLLAF